MKRARDTTISDLPPETLARVFSTLGGVSLARASAVCREWRAVIAGDGATLWRGVCARAWLLDRAGAPLGKSPASAEIRSLILARSAAPGIPPAAASGERGRAGARAALARAYRAHYAHYLPQICAHCLLCYSYPLAYPLFDNVRLCHACRMLEPFAYISMSRARRLFRLGTAVREREGRPLRFAQYDSGRRARDGSRPMLCTIYRAMEVLELTAFRTGKSVGEVREDARRRGFTLAEMQGVHIKDV